MEYIKSFDDLLNMKRKGEYELACDIDCEGKTIKSGKFPFADMVY